MTTTAGFDGRSASAEDILARAGQMPGRTFAELVVFDGLDEESSRYTKGRVGAAAEAYFGMQADNVPEPDFRSAGIELKTVPLRPRDEATMVKERVYISMIDYSSLAQEEWASATVRSKLSRILFVYYEWLPRAPLGDLVVSDVVDWEPDPEMMRVFEADWMAVQALVLAGKAEDISESYGVALVAATKGPGGPPDRPQPHSDVLASRRAWALRPTFLKSVIERHRARTPRVFEVSTTLEQRALGRLARHVGARISDVETTIGMAPSKAKHRAALVVQKALAARGGPTRRGLADVGVDLRVVQADESLRPYEALSFPAFRYQELIREDWDESELLSLLNRFLLVPIVGDQGLAAVASCVVRQPWIWAPTDDELGGIAREWAMFRDEIEAGRALELTPASQTQYIHVRPKGRTALDTDPGPVIGPVVKKCFWFNRDFVAEILRRGPADTRFC